jgi:mono/diheme cytochrome c family protein
LLAAGSALLIAQAGCRRTASAPVAAGSAPTVPARPAAKVSFNEHIQPILSEYCYHCHGPDKNTRKAELRLDVAADAFAPRKNGPALVKGQPDKSPVYTRLFSKDPDEVMPPAEAHKTLKPEEIALLRQWITEGAVYENHWAFIAPTRPAVPALEGSKAKIANPIDAFILARLAQEKLSPSPEADRATLLRRVSYDLTGLPPTPAETAAFLADPAPDAYERVVDRLLASPRYGEHRARYWLDYARYGDTHGLHFDNYRAIWPYRDYVIRAFNANKPFDRFVREQLAGDLLPAKSVDELVATGFVRCSVTTNEGGTVTEEVAVNLTRDRVEAFGATFLGLTTGCAACHDHKFDPITQKDHFQLAAFLSNTADKPWDFNIDAPGPILRVPAEANLPAVNAALAERAALEARLNALRAAAPSALKTWLAAGHRPVPVAPTALELRLRLDETAGDVVKNSAPADAARPVPATFKAETNPLVWGESSWFWPSVRFDIFTRLPLGAVGDVEADDAFSAGGWFMPRAKPGGGGTGDGAILARYSSPEKSPGRGWEIFFEKNRLVVNLADGPGGRALTVVSRDVLPNGEWQHIFFTYDGSRRAAGLKLYLNGKLARRSVRSDNLEPGRPVLPPAPALRFAGSEPFRQGVVPDVRYYRRSVLESRLPARPTIRTAATTYLSRRDDSDPLREARYQDFRFYRRALAPAEVARLPAEDVAAEVIARQPDPTRWTTDETFVVAEKFFLGQVDAEAKKIAADLAVLDNRIDVLTRTGAPTLIARERAQPAYADILKRGDYYARVQRVAPGTPSFLPPLPAGASLDRRGLADWLLTPEQPLLTRVTVNRMWQEVFGRGLVETAGDFGIMGARPSHAALLDWLAVELRESGWDVKKFYRTLVTSATYRQSATVTPALLAADPGNKLLARGPRFRMDGEMLRDTALATSGLLVEKIGGPSVKPYQPAGLWEEVAMPESNTKKYVPGTGEDLHRRSVYTFWKRASPPPSLETFDATSREFVCVRRARTNTPLQAFVTMNDPQFVEAARKLAERAVAASPAAAARLDTLAHLTLGRTLQPAEQAALERTRAKFAAYYRDKPAEARALLAVGSAPADAQLDPVELAEWTLVSSQFFNLDEFLTK